MTREVAGGKWKEGWVPSKVSSKNMPFLKMPSWLAHQDQAKPYNNDRREGTGHWQKNNPQPEVSWGAEWDTSKSWRTVARTNAKGRKAWVEEYVATKKEAEAGSKTAAKKLKSMQYKGKNWKELTKDQLKLLVAGKLDRKNLKGKGTVKDPVSANHSGMDRFKKHFNDDRGDRSKTYKPKTYTPKTKAKTTAKKPATAAKKKGLAAYGSKLSKSKSKTRTRAKTRTTKKAPVRTAKKTTRKAPVRTTKKKTAKRAKTRTKTKTRAPVRKRTTRKATQKRRGIASRSSFKHRARRR